MARGNRVTTPDAQTATKARTLLSQDQWVAIGLSLGLSTRELDVVRCIFDGCSEEAIAQALNISTHTVHTHLDRLYRKLHVTTRSDLILHIFAEYVFLGRRERGVAPIRPLAWTNTAERSPVRRSRPKEG